MKWIARFVAPLLLAGVASADEVHLRNGNRLVGLARIEGDRVVIELKIGTVSVPRSEVDRIEPGRCIQHDYFERLAGAESSGRAETFFALAEWAKAEGLTRYVGGLCERVLAIEPDHAGARRALGYVRHEGRWLTPVEHLKARGYVEFRGRWVQPAERDLVLAAEQARKAKAKTAVKPAPVRQEPVLYLGLPPYPRGRGSRAYGGAWTLYGYYGPSYGLRRGHWGYHWAGPHSGSYGGRP